jgi:hypothetical protein
VTAERREHDPKETPTQHAPVSGDENAATPQPYLEAHPIEQTAPENDSAPSKPEADSAPTPSMPAYVDKSPALDVHSPDADSAVAEDEVPRRRRLTNPQQVRAWVDKQLLKKKRNLIMIEGELNAEVETLIDEIHRSRLSLAFSNQQLANADAISNALITKMDNLYSDMKQCNDDTDVFINDMKSKYKIP